tara:strand:- start:33 stop:494 length:462 start_codon:yes stop_codon:yes gene_type:complete
MFLGFGDDFKEITYEDASQKYNKLDDELGYDEEAALCKDFGDVTFLTDFPLRTHPFWNMKYGGSGLWNKVDIIMHGQETIGSAERAVDVDEMREQFHTISNGEYAGLLYNHFSKERVEAELEEYLKHDFFPRFGGGIGVTRMVRAMEMSGLLK